MSAGTTYFVRAYATNSAGTAYGNEWSFTTAASSNSVVDIDGNVNPIVAICSQVWTAKNLEVSKYTDGTTIPQVTDPAQWS
ncbi:MAG: hypothetical protein FGM46_04190, partial [Ferruginibacter sp.]|nr:hypothetical protein [Ferruginibacter sp.]